MPCAFQLSHPPRRTSECQFAVAENELVEFDGKTWCPFHLPLSAGTVESAKAQWDVAQVKRFNEAIFACVDEAKKENDQADLSGVVFAASISFERYCGEENSLPSVRFAGTRFHGVAGFDGVTFGGDASFREATFDNFAFFRRARFGRDTWFRRARFGDYASFREATFDGAARFGHATFGQDASFREARFVGVAEFEGVTFGRGASFDAATFDDCAGFEKATFSAASFAGASFGGDANFGAAVFAGDAKFVEATFGGGASFLGDPTREGADIFPRFLNFRKATFNGWAVFNNRRFLHGTDFRGATFSLAPEFHNAVLHQDTDFAGTDFRDRKGTDEVDAARAYRTLKLAMASVRSTDEEARFYGYEQQSLRARKGTHWWVKLFSWLYEQTSEYGQNFLRPFLCLIGTFAFFSLVYFAALVGPITLWTDIQSVLRFALQQMFQPFSAFRTGAVVPGAAGQAVPLGLAFLGAVHSLLTFSFLALFLLALRRRFRLN